MEDLNTKFANYHQTCMGRQGEHQRQEATARAQVGLGAGDMPDEMDTADANHHKMKAQRWGVRAEHAKQGVFAVHSDKEGVAHQFEYDDLKSEADAAHRSLYLDDRDQPLDHNKQT